MKQRAAILTLWQPASSPLWSTRAVEAEAAAGEIAATGGRVIAVQAVSDEEFQARVRNMSQLTMVGRNGRPDDIANAVAFLASPDSGFVTAQILTIDGGRTDYIGHG